MDDDLKARIDLAVKALLDAGAKEVYLFGSVAEGTDRPDSDVDLAVKGLPPREFIRAYGAAADALSKPVSLVDLDVDDPFTRHLWTWGKLHRVG